MVAFVRLCLLWLWLGGWWCECRLHGRRAYAKENAQAGSVNVAELRESVRVMFQHAYEGYLTHAYPYDELRPLSCDGVETWGSYSLTLIDALDTLAVMGNNSEFRRVYKIVTARKDFDMDINVSVFETNIRIVGGLLSAHLMAKRAGVQLEKGWPCAGPLLRLAEDAVNRLLPAFDTPTGMPYGTVNLRHGVPEGETPVTCTATVGTVIIEFGALSRLTGNPVYEEVAMRALRALWHHRSNIGLVGNHIDVLTGKWTATDAGIGAGVDSYYEYLAKGSGLLQRPELMAMFKQSKDAIEQYLKHDDWYFWVSMKQGTVTMPVFQSLEAFWPGVLSFVGENTKGLQSMHNYHQIWKQFGFLPEFYNVPQADVSSKREGYPLRPELVESAMYLYRATKDPFLLRLGEDMLKSIQHSAKTECGYATVKDVRSHKLEDRMESFFLAETTKYLYLLFDEDNFIHNPGKTAQHVDTAHGTCVLDAGGYIFNSEAHPIDPAALHCCSAHTEQEVKTHISEHMLDLLDPNKFKEFRGDLMPQRVQQIEKQREAERRARRKRKEDFEKKMAELRQKERDAIEKKKGLEELRKKAKEQREAESKALEEEQDSPWEPEDEDAAAVGHKNATSEVIQPPELDEDILVDYDDVQEQDEGETIIDTPSVEANTRTSAANDPRRMISIASDTEPEFSSEEAAEVKESQGEQVLIKRQSKDEALEAFQPAVSASSDVKKLEKQAAAAEQMLDALSQLVNKLLPATATKRKQFDLDDFTERVFQSSKKQYPLEDAWYSDYTYMACPAQSFLERFSLQGEFFQKYA